MKYLTEDLKWISFYPKWNASMFVEKAGYFDERPQIHTSVTQLLILFSLPLLCFVSLWFLFLIPFIFFGWGKLYINLPIKTGIQDCDSAAWGFNYHGNTIWWYIGGGGNFEGGKKWKTFDMPWSKEWYRTSTLLKDGTWFHETKKNRKSWEEDINGEKIGSYGWLKKNQWEETHDYIDKFDKTTVKATISVEEREWRMKFLYFTPIFNFVRKTIAVEFNVEVGKRKGSWKGGTLGCGYDLRKNETPAECLKRMESERSF